MGRSLGKSPAALPTAQTRPRDASDRPSRANVLSERALQETGSGSALQLGLTAQESPLGTATGAAGAVRETMTTPERQAAEYPPVGIDTGDSIQCQVSIRERALRDGESYGVHVN